MSDERLAAFLREATGLEWRTPSQSEDWDQEAQVTLDSDWRIIARTWSTDHGASEGSCFELRPPAGLYEDVRLFSEKRPYRDVRWMLPALRFLVPIFSKGGRP